MLISSIILYQVDIVEKIERATLSEALSIYIEILILKLFRQIFIRLIFEMSVSLDVLNIKGFNHIFKSTASNSANSFGLSAIIEPSSIPSLIEIFYLIFLSLIIGMKYSGIVTFCICSRNEVRSLGL